MSVEVIPKLNELPDEIRDVKGNPLSLVKTAYDGRGGVLVYYYPGAEAGVYLREKEVKT